MTEPPDFKNMKIDFSIFHPIDHWPFGAYCRSLHGGPRTHLKYAWEYRRKQQVLKPWHALQCRRGRHEEMHGWSRNPDPEDSTMVPWKACEWCARPM